MAGHSNCTQARLVGNKLEAPESARQTSSINAVDYKAASALVSSAPAVHDSTTLEILHSKCAMEDPEAIA